MFFFEKKNQKTFAAWVRGETKACLHAGGKGAKVFCFFFSKKKNSSFP
jgi:hypothetical protein